MVYAITCGDPVSKDFKFCDQARDAAGSVARNIAEGFGRYRHKEFAQFLSIARGSVFEVRDHLHDGARRNYWTREQVADIESLCNRTIAALTRFIRFLRNNPDP